MTEERPKRKATLADLEAEVDRLHAHPRYQNRPELRPHLLAYLQYLEGMPIDQRCPFCGHLLTVTGGQRASGTAWHITCPCGKCDGWMKGF